MGSGSKMRKKIINKMCFQGIHYKQHNLFFTELWKSMRESFSEENDTTTASFILERLIEVLPKDTVNENALIDTINEVYKEG